MNDAALAVASLEEHEIMADLIFLVITVGFFAVSIAYTHGCEKLRGRQS
ncbi:MAG TPA: hypothetical protein VH142_19395 [Polyangiaceae bacterium]|jgi:hypothetical protein|nr:hypothetical protein [Polyangiaceae bacterium]